MDIRLKNTRAYLRSFMANAKLYYKNFILNTPVTRRYGQFKINATGELINSLEVTEEGTNSSFNFDLLANEYIHTLDEGSTSVSANLNDLVNWIERKPVTIQPSATLESMGGATPENLAKLIQTSLGRNGIQPMNFLQRLYENRYNELLNNITDPVVSDVTVDIEDKLKKSGYVKKGNSYTLETK